MQWSPIEFFSLYVLFSHGGLKEILPCLLYIMPMYAHRTNFDLKTSLKYQHIAYIGEKKGTC